MNESNVEVNCTSNDEELLSFGASFTDNRMKCSRNVD